MSLFLGRQRRSLPRWGVEPPIPPFYGADVFGGATVGSNPDTALQVPTVWACVAMLSNAVSMLPLETYRQGPDGVPRKILSQLLTNPSGDMTQSEWLHMLMVSLLLRGNAYGRITSRDGQLRPTQIALLSPDAVQVNVDRTTGKITYKLGNGSGQDITDDIWHVRGMTMPGSVVGLSPISYAAATIGVDLASRQFAQDFFNGGGIPKAVVKTDQAVTQEQSRTIKDRLLAASRNREPVVLGQGLDYQAISVKPEESQFLLTQQANVSQIARYFGVPAEMVGGSSGNSMTYANVEQRQLDFFTLGVSFWLKRIEDAVFTLLPQPQYARFNTAALLRTDAKTQAEVDNMQLAGKTRVPSELRQRDGLPPFTAEQQKEADMVPLTVTPGGGAKALPALKEPPGPEAPVPAGDQQQNSAPVTIHNHLPAPAEVRLVQPITVAPTPVRVPDVHVTVEPSPPAEVRQDIHVAPAEVRMVQVGDAKPATRSRRVERDQHGDIVRIVEE